MSVRTDAGFSKKTLLASVSDMRYAEKCTGFAVLNDTRRDQSTMSLWQSTMIWFARNKTVTRFAQRNPLLRGLASRFVGGPDLPSVIAKAAELNTQGFTTSLYYLGEYVDSSEVIEENVLQIIDLIRRVDQTDLDVLISVDPTQIGYSLSDDLGQQNALRIIQVMQDRTKQNRLLLMLDMEDFSYVQRTLALQGYLAQNVFPAAITIQAYLRRSEQDIRDLIQRGVPAVRLVKGAFAENRERAWTDKADIDKSFLNLAKRLLSPESQAQGVYPIFATHDDKLIDQIIPIAEENGWSTDAYEFELLYGVRAELQAQLVARGFHVRLYVPFGTAWWPYSVRRIGENPANARFVFRAIWRS
jgi:proline dehydrogenase